MADANIRAVITAKDDASGVLKKFGEGANKVGGAIAGAAKVAGEALLVAGAAAAGFGVVAVKAFEDSQNRIAQTNAVLASTKGIAGVTADAVDKLSKSLQKQTTYSDEDVRSVENLLLTFTAIGKDIFPQATKTVLNMATALGEDTKSASIQLGKALQDPILGITALRRVGVNFNDAQKEVIKNLVNTGHQAEAQKAILKELNTEFGNSAEAARHTFGGSLKALKNQLNDVEEAIGGTITKYLQPFIQKAADAVASINWESVINKTIQDLKDFAQELDKVWQWFDKIYQQVEHYLKPKLEALWGTIKNAFPVFRQFIDQYINPLVEALATAAGKSIVWAIGEVVDIINALLRIMTPVIKFLDDNKGIVYAFAGAFIFLRGTLLIWDVVDKVRVAFETLQLVTIPNTIASLTTFQTFLTGFGGWAIFGAAGVAAFIMIQNAARDTKKVLDDTAKAVSDNYDSINSSVSQLKQLMKTGTPEQQARARAALNAPAFRATGGPIMAGSPYIVGEQGPELVVPQQSGTVIPNNKLNSGTSLNVTFNGIFTGSQQDFRQLAVKLHQALNDAKGMGTI